LRISKKDEGEKGKKLDNRCEKKASRSQFYDLDKKNKLHF